jgi:hypothetical protein
MTAALLPDCGGLIETMATALHPEMFASAYAPFNREYAGLRHALAQFIARLEPGMRLIIFTEQRSLAAAEAWLAEISTSAAVSTVSLTDGTMRSAADLWCQDDVLVARTRDGDLEFLRPGTPPGQGTPDGPADGLAHWLVRTCGGRVRDVPLHIDGGNLLTGRDFRIIGADSVRLSAESCHGGIGTRDDALQRVAAIDPRALFIFAGRDPAHQPVFHIDLVLTLTGLDDAGHPLLLLAEAQALSGRHAPAVRGLNAELDAAAMRLRADGFAVRRLPIPYAAAPLGRAPRLRPLANALVDNAPRAGGSRPLVWLPGFGDLEPVLAEFDAEAVGIWTALGFEVRLCPGWSAAAHCQGALRCAIKVIRRIAA